MNLPEIKTKIKWYDRLLLLFVRKQYLESIDGNVTTCLEFKQIKDKVFLLDYYQIQAFELNVEWSFDDETTGKEAE